MALVPTFVAAAAAYDLPASLLEAMCWWESGWQANVVSPTGAIGMCQLEPYTTAFVNSVLLGGANLNADLPGQNITLAAAYLHYLLTLTGGSQSQALAGYYQGLLSVQQTGCLPPPRPTCRASWPTPPCSPRPEVTLGPASSGGPSRTARPPRASIHGVRVRRSFAFLDLSGFTTLTAVEGDERAVSVLTVFRSTLREICSRRGVRIAKWLGDGAMLVGVETTPLLAATLEMQWVGPSQVLPISVRAGVTTGEVILLEGDDYIGHSVNLAARLCDIAHAHEVLAAPEVLGSLPPWGMVIDSVDVAVRGITEPVPVARLGRHEPSDDAVPDPVCGLPLTESTAGHRREDAGGVVLFCSESCLDTWTRRPDSIGALECHRARTGARHQSMT